MLQTAITERWGLDHPIVQAPMAGVAGGELAGAVSAAGGLGMLGVGRATPVGWVRAEAARAAASGRPWGAGLMAWVLRERGDLLDAVLAEGPRVVAISFGDVAPYADAVHAAGADLAVQVQTAADAEQALAAGADALVAQGTDAGGHTGQVGTLPLLQVVLERAGSVPVLAGGGVATGAAVAAVLALGAEAAWIGTRFAATREGTQSEAAKAAIVAASAEDTVLTRVYDLAEGHPWPARYPGRALRSPFTDRWHGREDELERDARAASAEVGGLRDAGVLVYAGQASGAVHDIPRAGELVARLAGDAEQTLRRRAGELLSGEATPTR
jgi:nitronate monooxygenase